MKRIVIMLALGAAFVSGNPAASALKACEPLGCSAISAVATCDEGGSESCVCHYMYEPVRGHVCTP